MKTIKASDMRDGVVVAGFDGRGIKAVRVGKGFVRFAAEGGKSEGSVLIDWANGSWSQVPLSEEYELIDPARMGG